LLVAAGTTVAERQVGGGEAEAVGGKVRLTDVARLVQGVDCHMELASRAPSEVRRPATQYGTVEQRRRVRLPPPPLAELRRCVAATGRARASDERRRHAELGGGRHREWSGGAARPHHHERSCRRVEDAVECWEGRRSQRGEAQACAASAAVQQRAERLRLAARRETEVEDD